MTETRTLVLIPAHNEEETIEEVVRRAMKYAQVCVVDDCSRDRTYEILTLIDGAHVIRHEKNTNYGGAVTDGPTGATARRAPAPRAAAMATGARSGRRRASSQIASPSGSPTGGRLSSRSTRANSPARSSKGFSQPRVTQKALS